MDFNVFIVVDMNATKGRRTTGSNSKHI